MHPSPGADVGTVPAQMWTNPGADVDESRRRCGLGAVPAQMWAQSRRSPGADIGLIGSSRRFVCSPSFGVLLDILKDVRPILLSAQDTMPHGIPRRTGYHAARDSGCCTAQVPTGQRQHRCQRSHPSHPRRQGPLQAQARQMHRRRWRQRREPSTRSRRILSASAMGSTARTWQAPPPF